DRPTIGQGRRELIDDAASDAVARELPGERQADRACADNQNIHHGKFSRRTLRNGCSRALDILQNRSATRRRFLRAPRRRGYCLYVPTYLLDSLLRRFSKTSCREASFMFTLLESRGRILTAVCAAAICCISVAWGAGSALDS